MIIIKENVKKMLQEKNITFYTIKKTKLFSACTFNKIVNRTHSNITLDIINKLCCVLECNISDVIEYIETSEDRQLINKNRSKD